MGWIRGKVGTAGFRPFPEKPVKFIEEKVSENRESATSGHSEWRPKVGDTVWVFDVDRRIYPKPEPGRIWASGGPIFREHFVPRTIVDETRKSWHLNDRTKIDKRTKQSAKDARGYRKQIYNATQVDDLCYVHDRRYELSQLVLRCDNANLLRRVAALFE